MRSADADLATVQETLHEQGQRLDQLSQAMADPDLPEGAVLEHLQQRLEEMDTRLQKLEQERGSADLPEGAALEHQLKTMRQELVAELEAITEQRIATSSSSEASAPQLKELQKELEGQLNSVRQEVNNLVEQQATAGMNDGLHDRLEKMAEGTEGLAARFDALQQEVSTNMEARSSPGTSLTLDTLREEADRLLEAKKRQSESSLTPVKEALDTLLGSLPDQKTPTLIKAYETWAKQAVQEPLAVLSEPCSSPLEELARLLQIRVLAHEEPGTAAASRPTALALKVGKAIFQHHKSIPDELAKAMDTLSVAGRIQWIAPKAGEKFNSRHHEVVGQEQGPAPANTVLRVESPGVLDLATGGLLEKAQVVLGS